MQISPSILSADFANLEAELGRIANADWAHVDVMDAHFVPNLTLGLPVVEALLKVSPVPLDAHLMIEDPDRWAPQYAEAGCQSVTFHIEAARDPRALARALRAAGARASMAIKPGTDFAPLARLPPEPRLGLVWDSRPGPGGPRTRAGASSPPPNSSSSTPRPPRPGTPSTTASTPGTACGSSAGACPCRSSRSTSVSGWRSPSYGHGRARASGPGSAASWRGCGSPPVSGGPCGGGRCGGCRDSGARRSSDQPWWGRGRGSRPFTSAGRDPLTSPGTDRGGDTPPSDASYARTPGPAPMK